MYIAPPDLIGFTDYVLDNYISEDSQFPPVIIFVLYVSVILYNVKYKKNLKQYELYKYEVHIEWLREAFACV